MAKESVWCVIKNGQNEFLLLKRSAKSNNGGQWNFPGGGIDEGESVMAAATRECHEEAGFRVDSWKKILTVNNDGKLMTFVRPTSNIEPKVFINSESSKARWFSHKDMRHLNLHFPTMQFIKHLSNKKNLEFRKQLVKSSLFMDVYAYLGEESVATAKICIPTRKLHNVYVNPFYRGCGYGHELMAHLMTLENHPTCLTANCGQDSTMSIQDLVQFYHGYGFVESSALASTTRSGPIPMKLLRCS